MAGVSNRAFAWYVASYALGRLLAEDLIEGAVAGLNEGLDSPTLRRLAGSHGDDDPSPSELFAMALKELGIHAPTDECDAYPAMIADVATRFRNGQLKLDAAVEELNQLYWQVDRLCPESADILSSFISPDIMRRSEIIEAIASLPGLSGGS
jgi:hypothetical protein